MSEVVVIPAGIDINAILERNNVRQERSKSRLKDFIYYVLSRVVTHEGNYKLYIDDGGFRPISTNRLKILFGSNYNRDKVLRFLKDTEDPIIESNGSYQVGNFPKSYRLPKKYRTGEIEYRTLGAEFSKKIEQLKEIDPSLPDYGFLVNQFHLHQLEFSEDIDKFIKDFGISLLSLANNEFQKEVVFNKVGGLIRYKEYIQIGSYHTNHSDSNHRFNSILTMMPKELRNFLLVNGESLVEVDLGSSQPYLLAVLLKNLNDGIGVQRIDGSKDSSIKSLFSIDDYLTKLNNELVGKVYSFMLPAFSELPSKLKRSIEEYCSLPYNEDFYQWVSDHSGNHLSREAVKDSFMYFLFDSNPRHRKHNVVIREIGTLFPGVNFFINQMHDEVGKSDFARFLQLVESHFIINLILREFHENYPHIPIFTIHDAILTNEENASCVQEFLVRRLNEMTSLPPKSKISHQLPVEIILQKSIKKRWKSIRRIRTEAQYRKIEHSIFTSNIDKGKTFLRDVA